MSNVLYAILIVLIVSACSLQTTAHQEIAQAHHFQQQVVATNWFKHLVYTSQPSGAGVLHVYIEGDGTPWINGTVIARDPSPRHPLALQLMAADSTASAYIGRPCHFVAAQDKHCVPEMWTAARYGPAVVSSMTQAINQVVADSGATEVVLIGYSGGGVLALLVAGQVRSAKAVITIAANLDIDAWTRTRGFDTLAGSVNPISQPALPMQIRQLHLIGLRDSIVPPDVTRAYVELFKVKTREYPEYDHHCCWLKDWPQLLLQINKQLVL